MELSKTILYSLVIVALLVGAVDVAAGDDASTVGTDATEAVGGVTVGTDDAEAVGGVTVAAENAQCSSDNCNVLIEGGSCESLPKYVECIEQVLKDCDDVGQKEEIEKIGQEKTEKINSFHADLGCPTAPVITSAPSEPARQPEISVPGPTASTEITANEPVVKETTVEPTSELLTTEGITIKSTKTSTPGEQQVTKKIPSESVAEAEEEVSTASSTIPTTAEPTLPTTTEPPSPITTEPPLPKCEDPIAKAAEVQKCSELIKPDSFCIQLQKAVDCIEVRANCSVEIFDKQVEKYLDSLENYAMDHKCIITYNGKRLQYRRKSGEAGESQALSGGSSPISICLFSSFAVIFAGLFI